MRRLKQDQGMGRSRCGDAASRRVGVLTIALPARAFAAVAGGGVAVGHAAQHLADRSAGAGGARGHDRGDHRHRHHLGGERARHRRAQDVGDGLWRRGGAGRDHADDGAVSGGGRAFLSAREEATMNGEGRRLNVIHQSLVRPVLLAGAERPLAIANWITAAALILGGGPMVHGRARRAARDRGPLGAGAARQDRSGTEPGLHPPHSLSPGPLSGAGVDLGAAAGADSADRAAAARAAWMTERRGGKRCFSRSSRFKTQGRSAAGPARSAQLRLCRGRRHHRDQGRGAAGRVRVSRRRPQLGQHRGTGRPSRRSPTAPSRGSMTASPTRSI